MRFIDVFGGIGGFSLGLERCGHECVGYYEWDKYACGVYNKNFGTSYEPTDITKVAGKDIPDFDILCGGFPCQPFSIAGKRQGFRDIRGTLFAEIVRIAKEKRPGLLFLENVKGLLNHDNGETFGTILHSLHELGYSLEWEVLNSKNFGVPQNRERVFIIGHLGNPCGREVFPLGAFSQKDGGSCREAQGKGERICSTVYTKPHRGDGTYIVYPQVLLKDNNSKGYSVAEPYDGIRLQFPTSTTARGRVVKGNSQTLQTSGPGGVLLADKRIRTLTPVECERLQGFPDNWTAGFSDTQRYKMLGNAVTVNVIEAIGRRLRCS